MASDCLKISLLADGGGTTIDCNEHSIIPEDLNKKVMENVTEHYTFLRILKDMEAKFGRLLGGFLIDYIFEFFKFNNMRASKFLLTRSSCWRYKDIGTNWKSKRFLADVNYIFSKAGVPLLTHVDKKVMPSKLALSKSLLIPRCDVNINREVLDYDITKVKEELNKELEFCKSKKEKRSLRKQVNLLVLHSKGQLERSSKEFEGTLSKYKKIISSSELLKNIPERKDVYKPLSFKYRDAIMKSAVESKLNYKKKFEVFDKIVCKKIKEGREANKPVLRALMKNIKDAKSSKEPCNDDNGYMLVGTKKHYFLQNKENEIKLENYYSVLETHVEETNNSPGLSEEDVKFLVSSYFRSDLGFGRNMHNIKSVINGNCNKVLKQTDGFRQPSKTVIGFLDSHCIVNLLLKDIEATTKLKKSNVRIWGHFRAAKVDPVIKYEKRFIRKKIRQEQRRKIKKAGHAKRKRIVFEESEPKECLPVKKIKISKNRQKVDVSCLKSLVFKNIVKISLHKHEINKSIIRECIRKKEIAAKTRAANSIETDKNQIKQMLEAVALNKQCNRDFWTCKTNIGGIYMGEFKDYDDEKRRKEREIIPKFTASLVVAYPCVFNRRFYLKEGFSCLALMAAIFKGLSKEDNDKINSKTTLFLVEY